MISFSFPFYYKGQHIDRHISFRRYLSGLDNVTLVYELILFEYARYLSLKN